MSKNFGLREFIHSDTAKKRGIDNTPTFEVVFHLDMLCDRLLQPFREFYGKAIIVTSGYRCDELNKAVDGKPTSGHKTGYACDVVPADMGDWDNFIACAKQFFVGKDFDQVIIEKSSKGKQWLHISYKHIDGSQRKQLFEIKV